MVGGVGLSSLYVIHYIILDLIRLLLTIQGFPSYSSFVGGRGRW